MRQAEKGTLIISEGFSCREQIAQATDREALHRSQVLQIALHEGSGGPSGGYPEKTYQRMDQDE